VTFDHQKVLGEVEYSLDQYGFVVVTMHPQDFAVRDMLNHQNKADYGKIGELEMLLDRIQERGIKIVTISEINSHVVQEPGIQVRASQPGKEEKLAAR
jgi:hypothetical protein